MFRKTKLQFASDFHTFIRYHELSFVVLLFTCLFTLKRWEIQNWAKLMIKSATVHVGHEKKEMSEGDYYFMRN